MNYDLTPVDSLVSNIVGTANLISKVLFTKNSVVAAVAISGIIFVIVQVL